MANIKINELQPSEFAELSDLELEAIVGGKNGFLNIGNWGPSVDKFVRNNLGGWVNVVKTGVQLYTGGGFRR